MMFDTTLLYTIMEHENQQKKELVKKTLKRNVNR